MGSKIYEAALDEKDFQAAFKDLWDELAGEKEEGRQVSRYFRAEAEFAAAWDKAKAKRQNSGALTRAGAALSEAFQGGASLFSAGTQQSGANGDGSAHVLTAGDGDGGVDATNAAENEGKKGDGGFFGGRFNVADSLRRFVTGRGSGKSGGGDSAAEETMADEEDDDDDAAKATERVMRESDDEEDLGRLGEDLDRRLDELDAIAAAHKAGQHHAAASPWHADQHGTAGVEGISGNSASSSAALLDKLDALCAEHGIAVPTSARGLAGKYSSIGPTAYVLGGGHHDSDSSDSEGGGRFKQQARFTLATMAHGTRIGESGEDFGMGHGETADSVEGRLVYETVLKKYEKELGALNEKRAALEKELASSRGDNEQVADSSDESVVDEKVTDAGEEKVNTAVSEPEVKKAKGEDKEVKTEKTLAERVFDEID